MGEEVSDVVKNRLTKVGITVAIVLTLSAFANTPSAHAQWFEDTYPGFFSLQTPGLLQATSPAQAVISRPEVLTATTVEASEEASALAVSMPSAGRTTTAMTTPTTTLMATAAGNGSWFRRSTACNGNWSTSASKDRSEAARLRQHGAPLHMRSGASLYANRPRSCGAVKSSSGPIGTMPVGFTCRWLP